MPRGPIQTKTLLNLTDERHPLGFGFSRHDDPKEQMFDVHFELEIGLVLQGEMVRYWDDVPRRVGPGQVWLSSVWEPHGFELAQTPCEVLVFLPRPEMLSAIELGWQRSPSWHTVFFTSPDARPQLSTGDGNYFLGRTRRLEHLMKNDPEHAEWDAVLMMTEILSALLRGEKRAAGATGKTVTFGSIQRAVEMVFEARQTIPEARAASACGMSLTTFRRRFKENMGLSFGRFALNHRLKMASRELLTDMPIKEVAERWGFSDLSHFYRAFKRVFVVPPRAYRERGRGGNQ